MTDRPRLLFCWELGANYDHAVKLGRVAEELSEDAEIFIAARDPAAVRAMGPELSARLLPAPFAITRPLGPAEPPGANFPGNLLTEGWESTETLAGLIGAWQGLFDLVAPTMLVAQAAPTALLAAYRTDLPRVVLGSGYDNPPLATPMPVFDRGQPEAVALGARQEAAALAAANAALVAHGREPAADIAEILRPDLSVLACWPETDHWPERAAIDPTTPEFLGQILQMSVGTIRTWAKTGAPRVFAYLRPGPRPAAAAFGALHRLGPELDAILAAPGIVPEEAARLEARGVQVVNGPVRLEGLLKSCSLGISHGSNGIASTYLRFGVPQIALPLQREQAMFTRSLAAHNLGFGLEGRYGAAEVARAITHALAPKAPLVAATRAIAERLAAGSPPAERRAGDLIRARLGQCSRK